MAEERNAAIPELRTLLLEVRIGIHHWRSEIVRRRRAKRGAFVRCAPSTIYPYWASIRHSRLPLIIAVEASRGPPTLTGHTAWI